ncbi:MAG: hypothetical protein RBR59_05280 [Sulfurimonadaceae bacterium]|nr:hypothetical protein [Sulfurimonadaceae bacterium]
MTQFIKRNIYLVVVFTFVVSSLVVGAVFFYFKSQVKEQKLERVLDQIIVALDTKLKAEKMNALELALVISKNGELIDTLEYDDEDKGYKILSDIMMTIKKNTSRYIRAQIITDDYLIFARSWDDIYAGMPIGDYRQDLDFVKFAQEARTSIEVGRRLGIKASVPVYRKGRLLGFVEVIDFFESLTSYFRALGIDAYALLDYKYYNDAVLMQENVIVQKHIVANLNHNFSHLQTLNNIDFKTLKTNRVVHADAKYIFYETMYDGNHEPIGAFVFVLPQEYLEYFRDPEDDISFLMNVTRTSLYGVVQKANLKGNVYEKYSAESLLYIKDIVMKEDRELFVEEAYKKLDTYTKDELIQLMLDHKVIKKIDGKIR